MEHLALTSTTLYMRKILEIHFVIYYISVVTEISLQFYVSALVHRINKVNTGQSQQIRPYYQI